MIIFLSFCIFLSYSGASTFFWLPCAGDIAELCVQLIPSLWIPCSADPRKDLGCWARWCSLVCKLPGSFSQMVVICSPVLGQPWRFLYLNQSLSLPQSLRVESQGGLRDVLNMVTRPNWDERYFLGAGGASAQRMGTLLIWVVMRGEPPIQVDSRVLGVLRAGGNLRPRFYDFRYIVIYFYIPERTWT